MRPWLCLCVIIAVVLSMPGSELPGVSHHASQPRGGVSGIIKNKPLHATFERHSHSPTSETENWVTDVFRNKSGSLRTNLQHYSSILDAEGSRLIILVPSQKTALISPTRMDGTATYWGFDKFPIFEPESVSLINIPCRRVFLSNAREGPHDAGELWVAYDLGLVLKDVKPAPEGDIIWTITSLSLNEPDPASFKIPEGYSVTNFSSYTEALFSQDGK